MKKTRTCDLFILESADISGTVKEKLLRFNKAYQLKVLKYFAGLKLRFQKEFPGASFPGLFAEVDSISGRIRELGEQKAWSWGDCRGLGIWSYFLAKGTIPDDVFEIEGRKINLRSFFDDYCSFIYKALMERCRKNGGRFPFIVDIETNMASDDPRNVPTGKGELEPGHIFASSGISQYGVFKKDTSAFEMGMKFLEETYECGMRFANVDHISKKRSPNRSQGFLMVTLGAIVDILKCMEVAGCSDDKGAKADMLFKGRKIIDYILSNHFAASSGAFWESNSPDGKPFVNDKGHLICDPGHTAEFCGFAAEFCDFLESEEKKKITAELLKILDFVDRNAYSPAGVMYKNIDLNSLKGVADKAKGGKEYKTAPWWNVRECSAASIKLYQLTGKDACLQAYKKAQNATYLNYPNENIGGLMTQTLDADTLEPLPFHPATGNLDPMHSPRAREREIEALELI